VVLFDLSIALLLVLVIVVLSILKQHTSLSVGDGISPARRGLGPSALDGSAGCANPDLNFSLQGDPVEKSEESTRRRSGPIGALCT
jgi:hypothetical protein